jgi:hypothetical protein
VDIQRVGGNPVDGEPGWPSLHCEAKSDAQVNSPTWSSDGSMLAWGDGEGILVITGLTPTVDCTKTDSYRIAPGASEPDFSPAPPPAAPAPAPPAPQPPAPPVSQPKPPATQRVTVKLPAKHAKAVRKLGRKSRALTLVVTAGSATQTVVVAPRYAGGTPLRFCGSGRTRPA